MVGRLKFDLKGKAQAKRTFKPISHSMLTCNLVLLAAGEVLSRGLTFIAFVHLARVLGPAQYGLVELTLALMMFFGLLVDQGLGTLGAREIARRSSSPEPLISRIVSMQLMLAGAVYALLILGTLWLPISLSLRQLLLGYGIGLFGLPFLLQWVFQGRNQMIWVSLPQVLRWGSFTALVLVMIRQPEDLLLVPIAEILALALAVTMSLVVFTRAGERVLINLRPGWGPRILGASLPISGSQIIWALRMYLPTILLGFLADRAAVGFFGAAHRIVMVFQTMLNMYLINLFPSMTQAAQNSPIQLVKLLNRSLWFAVWPSLALALVIGLFAPSIVKAIYGVHYIQEETISILTVLVWIIPILVWRGHGRNALFSLNRQREELECSVAGLALLIVLGLSLSPTHGGLGFAWGMLAAELAATILIWWRLRREVSILVSGKSNL